jgi:MFS family permease
MTPLASTAARPRELFGRAALGVAAADIALMFMGSTLVTPLYGLYASEFGFSEVTLTLVYAAYVVGNLAALFFLGRLSDQIGRRRVTLPAIGIAGVATLVFLFAAGTAWLFVGRALSGLAIGLASGTGAAWIAELTEGGDKGRASAVATIANFVGIATGPLLAGVLAQYAAAPLRLSYVVYLALLAVLAFLVSRTRETVRARPAREASLRPRIGVPREIRVRFVSPAATAFATFALIGFYAALLPSVLRRDLGEPNLAVAGAIVGELFAVAAVAVYATRRLASRAAVLAGAALLVPSAAMLVAAQALASLPLLVAGTALCGVAAAPGYRGSLQVVNEIAPPEKRAEVLSSYLVACYAGNSVPVVGVGVLGAAYGPLAATATLACAVALLAILALAAEQRRRATAL